MKSCKIVIADDHPIVVEGIKLLIEINPRFEVIGEARDGLALLAILKKCAPDIVVVDLRMPRMQGAEAINEIGRLYPDVKAIVLSGFLNGDNIQGTFSSTVCGFVSKAVLGKELLKAIETVWKGGIYLSSDLIKSDPERFFLDSKKNDELTHREKQIITLIAEGFSSKQLSEILNISQRTVDKHRAHIMCKLKLQNVVELVRYAFINGYTF